MGTKNLEEIFNVETTSEPLVPEIVKSDSLVFSENSININPKLENSSNLKLTLTNILDKAEEVLDTMADEAITNPNPKNVEAVAKLIDAISKAAATFVSLESIEKDNEFKLSDSNRPKSTESPQIQKNTIILTTSELLSEISKKMTSHN